MGKATLCRGTLRRTSKLKGALQEQEIAVRLSIAKCAPQVLCATSKARCASLQVTATKAESRLSKASEAYVPLDAR